MKDKFLGLVKKNGDIIHREVGNFNNKFHIFFMSGFVKDELIENFIIFPILNTDENIGDIKMYVDKFIISSKVKICKTFESGKTSLLKGNVLILKDDWKEFVVANISSPTKRSITEPPSEITINGPREGFTENSGDNVVLLRKIIKSVNFLVENVEVGKFTKTDVKIAYINGLADKKILKKVKDKIKKINIDGILDSSYVSFFLEEKKNSIMRQVGMSEKPDVVASKILEGRIAIIVEGSPQVLTIPFMLWEDYQSANDYYDKSFKATMVRFVRVLSVFLAIILPGFYLSAQLYHYKAMPLKFLITIMNTTQGLPFTPFLEMLFVVLLFDILYESSLRIPQYYGTALGIIGALILGDTAVKAGLISSPAVMIVALSGLSIYTIPKQSGQLLLLRLFFILAGGVFGFLGVISGIIYLLAYSSCMDSYGVPYLSPLTPFDSGDNKDGIIKKNLGKMEFRPNSMKLKNKRRMKK